MLWSTIPNSKVHTKINERVNKYLYNWILQHHQVVKLQISNNCLRVSIGAHSEKYLIPKLSLRVSVQEFYNIMLSPQ